MNNIKTITFCGIYNLCEHCESITYVCYSKFIKIQVKGSISCVLGYYQNRATTRTGSCQSLASYIKFKQNSPTNFTWEWKQRFFFWQLYMQYYCLAPNTLCILSPNTTHLSLCVMSEYQLYSSLYGGTQRYTFILTSAPPGDKVILEGLHCVLRATAILFIHQIERWQGYCANIRE